MAAEWFYADDGQVTGPMAFEEARIRISHGINRPLLVWTEGMTQWAFAQDVPAFSDIFQSAALPIAQPGISSFELAASDTRPQEYTNNRGRILKNVLLSGALAAGSLFGSLDRAVVGSARATMALGVLFFGLGFVALLRQLFVRGPVLVITPVGFRLPRFASEMIAWSDVTALSRTKLKRVDTLKMALDPAVARSLTFLNRSGLIARFTRWRSNYASVVLSQLDCDPDLIAAQCASYVEAARAAAQLRGEPPRALPASALPAAFRLGTPWLTYALLALLAIVYACELQFAVNANKDGAPSVQTLAYLGGTMGSRIWLNGEWWRLFTAPFLHAGVLHILMNSVVLWLAGTALEKLMGWRWTAAIFAASALSGSLGSVLINAQNIVGVGASGGITGLLAASFVTSFRLPVGALRTRLQMRAVQTVIPAVLPFLSSGNGPKIDYAAHLGGVLAGGLLSLVILQLWPRERPEPRFGFAAAAFALLFVLIAIGSIIPIVHLRQYGR